MAYISGMKETGMSLIHTIERKLCTTCHAMMIAHIENKIISYQCIQGHEQHPPEHFRDKSNGE